MKILHVAPINVAGVPFAMMDMQRRFGHEARLVTLHRNDLTFPEDICLDLPLLRGPLAAFWRSTKSSPIPPTSGPPVIRPHILESLYFLYDDWRRQRTVEPAILKYELDEFPIIHYDGGLDLYRSARLARRWKAEGKKIICHYMGSDLRLRGIHPVIDELSDLIITNESDHLILHPRSHYVYIPFDCTSYAVRNSENPRLRIIHSPSKRNMKGTEHILPIVKRVQQERDVDFVLVERTPHEEVLRIKSTCDIAIEQVGNMGGTGYGRNSLETMAMGIPTITEMTQEYLEWMPENPFVLANRDTLFSRLIDLIDDSDQRRLYGLRGRAWVEKYHSYESVYSSLQTLYTEHGIA